MSMSQSEKEYMERISSGQHWSEHYDKCEKCNGDGVIYIKKGDFYETELKCRYKDCNGSGLISKEDNND